MMGLRLIKIFIFSLFFLSIVSYSLQKPLLSDKSVPLEGRLELLFVEKDEQALETELSFWDYRMIEVPEVSVELIKTLRLKELNHPRVQFYLNYFTGAGREHFGKWLERAGLYQNYIQGELRANGLPESIFYLAMIESGLNPYALSRAGAGGIWQFMPATGRRYGLRVDFWVDERRDLEKSTGSAIMYLTDLFHRFGSWSLALASYNAGENKVARVVEQYEVEDYWELIEYRGLKRETRDYLPKMIAACLIAENPRAYGFNPVKKDPLSYEKLEVKDAVDLSKVAEYAGVSVKEIERLNPDLRRGITPPGMRYELKLPQGGSEIVASVYDKLRVEPVVSNTVVYHKVGSGEALSTICKRYKVGMQEVQRINKISDPHKIRVGQVLAIPNQRVITYLPKGSSKSGKANGYGGDIKGRERLIYEVRRGDTLFQIARSYGVKVEEIKLWNDVDGLIYPGQKIAIYLDSGLAKKAETVSSAQVDKIDNGKQVKKVYKVKAGDSVWKIAKRYQVSPEEIIRWNQLDPPDKIKPGDKLVIILPD